MVFFMPLLYLTALSVINSGVCWQITVFTQSGGPLKDLSDSSSINVTEHHLVIIFPGTKWCGSGNTANDYNDLGPLESTDKCCRAHDHCVDIIEAGQSAHGLTNNGFFTKLNCVCDYQFLNCLRSDNTTASGIIGFVYFDGLDTQCFKEEYPIVQCASYYPRTKRCKEYQFNKKKARLYQYFDVPLF